MLNNTLNTVCNYDRNIMTNETVRQSNIELLRIISMVLIIMFHISYHGNWGNGGIYYPDCLNVNTFFLQCLIPFGKVGVNIFVLISGYFLINSTKSTWPKIAKLWIQMLFYSVTISFIFFMFDEQTITMRELFRIFTPTISFVWWFASTFLFMFALSPFINKAILACDEKTHIKLIIGLVIIWSIIPSSININLEVSNLGWFITLYVIASYFKLYPHRFNKKTTTYFIIAIMAYLTIIMITYLVDITHYSSDFWFISNPIDHNHRQNSILILVISCCLFLTFSKIQIKNSKIINSIASTTFGIYLIHDHDYVRWKIYSDIFNCYDYTYSDLLIPYVFFMTATIFIICMMIDYLRQLLFEKSTILTKLSKQALTLQSKIDLYISKIIKSNND